MDRLTAASAYSPTPRATKIPSTIVYNAKIHIDMMEGMTKRQNFFSNMIKPPFIDFHYKPSYNTNVKGGRRS